MEKTHYSRTKSIKTIARVAVFGAIASLLYVVPIFQFKLPIFPPFLEIHFDEIPVLIASLAYGPWTGVAILTIKTLIKLPFTSTICVGELADFLYGAALILPAAFIYKYLNKKYAFALGITVGTVSQLLVSLLVNIYIMIPFYVFVMGFTTDMILKMSQAVNPLITDIQWSLGLYAILPFNLLKDSIIISASILIYLPLKKVIKQINERNNN